MKKDEGNAREKNLEMKRLMKETKTNLQTGDIDKAEEIVEEMLKHDENSPEATTLHFIVQNERKEKQKNKIFSLIKSISMNEGMAAMVLKENLPSQQKFTETLKSIQEESKAVRLVEAWSAEYFPFFTTPVRDWEKREIISFFTFLDMPQVGENVLKEGFMKGTALIEMTVEDWNDLGLKKGRFREVQFWIRKFAFSDGASKTKISPKPLPTQPWDINEDIFSVGKWDEKGSERLPFKTLLLKKGDQFFYKTLANDAICVCEKLDIPPRREIDSIYMIHSDVLSARFNASLDVIASRWRSTPQLFRKKNWKKDKLREWYYSYYKKEEEKSNWNSERQVNMKNFFSSQKRRTSHRFCGWLMEQMRMQFGR